MSVRYDEEYETMTASEDKRNDKHFACNIPIVVSPFNSKDSMDALLVDCCMNGITFISKDAFFPGTALVIRVANSTLKDSCNSDLLKLPSIAIGEVKWCRRHPDKASEEHEIGIKYYYQDY